MFVCAWAFRFEKLVNDFLTYLPAGRARRLTINLLAYMVMSIKQLLTFTTDSEGAHCLRSYHMSFHIIVISFHNTALIIAPPLS